MEAQKAARTAAAVKEKETTRAAAVKEKETTRAAAVKERAAAEMLSQGMRLENLY